MNRGVLAALALTLGACAPPGGDFRSGDVYTLEIRNNEGFNFDGLKREQLRLEDRSETVDVALIFTKRGELLIGWRGARLYGPLVSAPVPRKCEGLPHAGMIAPTPARAWSALPRDRPSEHVQEWYCLRTNGGATVALHLEERALAPSPFPGNRQEPPVWVLQAYTVR